MRLSWTSAFVALGVVVRVWAADGEGVGPLSVPPSQFFDGNDGAWSTFFVQVGTPPQSVRVLPGTSASAGSTLWVVLPEGCTDANPGLEDCPENRHIFTRNESRTWSTDSLGNDGLYTLNTLEEGKLGLTGNAFYGFDTVQLGIGGSDMPVLESQLVAGIATNDFWLGSLGLSPVPFNFTNLNDPVPSMMGTLRNQSKIAGSSWGYTAGAAYHDPPIYGSLTLGGYDASRFNADQSLTDIGFGADFSRDLVVELQSITYSTLGSSPLLARSSFMFIDSLVPHMWLPTNACEAFEKAFNLTWNSTLELYLIDDAVHQAILAENPTFTFTLGAGGTRNDTTDITIPYAAFDLEVSQPIVESGSSRYFPLKQAQNSTQYTLGRVFLQEAYVIADFDRQNFTVAQALFPSTSQAQELHAILPPTSNDSKEESSLSAGVIAGIAIGAVALIAILIFGIWWTCRRKRRKSQAALLVPKAESSPEERNEGQYHDIKDHPELDGGEPQRHEVEGQKFHPPELDGQKVHPPELDGQKLYPPELDSQKVHPPELDGHDHHRYEMGSDEDLRERPLHEIDGRGVAYELDASPAR
ncbi:uncharacterized protein RCC_07996 [Ramularia collo-cygni]|uniref:Peptidase A1 domain-containing protein n=1 Tax=Ramularia collo-cygni TaxID=112498 RepID=A0A2D3VBE6_9PEZI|nr:uncharacterized protein RCC_07996 [Ramularia collo-cygni]CZT22127.1 uncharacterized protein RCC_07996 [Ramularia collo-cygni]